MKRDMDLVREILLAAEAAQAVVSAADLSVTGEWSDAEVLYHAAILIEAGYLAGTTLAGANGTPIAVTIARMTWEGHDFLDAVRDRTIWERTKTHLRKAGAGLMPALVKEVAVGLIRLGVGQIA
ncbi:DUF2513 domain-containing protein [Phaeospirillum tilakii]|uniref:DUF2513 domain-containing protein n=1 Tax=Phaeospirillum tilakii TaxID=741673 RepID=A0ABW5CC28_9PROT